MHRVSIHSLLDLRRTLAAALFADLTYPWAALPRLRAFIEACSETLPAALFVQEAPGVWIARSAAVAASAYLEAPCIVDEHAQLRSGAVLRGGVIVGKQAVVGPGTELKNTLLFDGVKAAHGNYLGDTVAGAHVHFGAGALTSNLPDDRDPVTVQVENTLCETGLRKLGAILGDEARVGAGSVLLPGCILGRRAVTRPLCAATGFVPAAHTLLPDGTLREGMGT